MDKWSRKYTLRSGLILVGLLAILSSGASVIASRILVREMGTLTRYEGRGLTDSDELRLIGLREVLDANSSILTREESYSRAARAGSEVFRERVVRMRGRTEDVGSHLLLDRIELAERAYREAFENAVRGSRGAPGNPADAAMASRGRALESALDSLVVHLQSTAVADGAAERASMRGTQAFYNWFTSATIVFVVAVCLLLIMLINRTYRDEASARRVAEEGQNRTTATLREVKAASHLKDQFLATVSHELRNPLAPILTWTQLLRSGTLDKSKHDRALEVIESNISSLSELIDDLVDVSRVVSGKFRLDVRPVDLLPVIRVAVESQRPASDAKHIRLQLVLDERAGPISGDSERLQQVMGNLLSNAIKFTPKGGSVQVTLARAESHVEMAVSDSGIGIAPEFLPHVFEPFQQAMDGSMRRHGGLGLGLSIVRHIVELHGGEIVAESPGPGKGARFTVKLPLLGTTESARGPRPRHPSAVDKLAEISLPRLDRISVLLVDDEPTANEALQTLLDSCGAEVRVAGSAAEALQVLDTWKPDVLISDIAMPEEDGYDLIRRVRTRSVSDGGETPAVALTAYAKIEDRVNILAAGFHMYLSKPADPSELVAVVASLAAGRRRGRTVVARPAPTPDTK